MLTKIIGVIAIIPILGSISVADASFTIDKITESNIQLAGVASTFNRDRVTNISQNTELKANDYLNSGTQKFNKQDYRGALADFDRAIQLDPNFVEVYNYRGNLKQHKLQDDRGALADFNRAIQLKPNYALLYRNRGVLKLTRLRDNRGALADFNRAIQLDPNFAEAYGQRGGIKHEILNDRTGGIADTQQAARLFKEQGDLTNYKVATGLLRKWQQADRKFRR